MANVQSPPGLLNISELLIRIRSAPFAMELFRIMDSDDPGYEKLDNCTMFSMHDSSDVSALYYYLQEKKYPARIQFAYIMFTLHSNSRDYQSLNIGTCIKEYPDDESLRKDIIILTNLRRCRDLLSGKYLKAYVLHNYAYHELPAEYWSYDKNWYRLLVDGCAQGNILSIGDFLGSIYFKEEDAERCSSIFPNKKPAMPTSTTHSSLINLDTYTTPWLQTLAAVHDKYGKDQLAQVAKSSIESFIAEYIKKHKLDISSSDIPFLAKFMRLAEQKEGKKYHAEQKLKRGGK